MTVQVVNGYICRNCTDVDRAKKGIDPAGTDAGRLATRRDPYAHPRPGDVGKLGPTGDVGTRLHVIA